jgi:hypothetical protein
MNRLPWRFGCIAQEDTSELVFDRENTDRIQVWGMHAERIRER